MSISVIESQQEFLELLQDAESLDGVHVALYGDGKLPKVNDYVLIRPVRNYRKSPGEGADVETYDLVIHVWVLRSGEFSGATADADRWGHIAAAEAELRRTDYRGYHTKGGIMAEQEGSLDLYDKGWVASSVVTFGVGVWQP